MKINGILLFLAIVIILPLQVISQENQTEGGIEKIVKIDISLDSTGVVTIDQELTLSETMGRLIIPKTLENLLIYDSKGNELGYEAVQSAENQLLKIYLKSQEDKTVRISYSTQALTRKNSSAWTISFYSLATSRATIVKISFPSTVNITSFRTNQTVYLYPPSLKAPIFLYPQEDKIKFEFDYRIIAEPITEKNDSLLYASVALFFLIIFASIILIYKKIKSPTKKIKESEEIKIEEVPETINPVARSQSRSSADESSEMSHPKAGEEKKPDERKHIKSSVLNMLDENEKKIVLMLEESDMEITQAYIYKTLGIPKASLSNIITRLEQRNLIEKKKEGRINWIKLKEWVFK